MEVKLKKEPESWCGSPPLSSYASSKIPQHMGIEPGIRMRPGKRLTCTHLALYGRKNKGLAARGPGSKAGSTTGMVKR